MPVTDHTLGADPGLGYGAPTSPRRMTRLVGDAHQVEDATLAEEVPVAFAYNRRTHVVMMCSPGDFEDLAVGFTVSEEIATPAEIGQIVVARHSRGVELTIEIPEAAAERLSDRQRAISGRTGCGLCGVEAIDDAVRVPRLVGKGLEVTSRALWAAGKALDARQPLNQQTHSIHAAAWARADGELVVVREDVGRHNALDKTLGALYRSGLDPGDGFIVLTSRASFELIQKAAVCGVQLVAAVSRPTGLAVRMAEESGITLVGLLRGESGNVYTHAQRVS